MHGLKFVHRDLKPENILLTSKNERNLEIKITDFGFAELYTDVGFDLQLGTPLYMAPEIVRNEKYDKTVDCWSIGVITWILLIGKPPFKGKNPKKVHKEILKGINWKTEGFLALSKDAKDFLKKTLAEKPKDRALPATLLKHPWITAKESQLERQKTLSKNTQVFSNLQNFARGNKFQQSMMSLMAGLLAKKEDLEALRAAFKAMDVDNDGFLSPKEIEAAEKNASEGSILSKALGPKE